MLGTVSKLDLEKGLGYLIDENNTEFYFQLNELFANDKESIRVKDVVVFTIKASQKGKRRAFKVMRTLRNTILPRNYNDVVEQINNKSSKIVFNPNKFADFYKHHTNLFSLIEQNDMRINFEELVPVFNETDASNIICSLLYHLPLTEIVILKTEKKTFVLSGKKQLFYLYHFLNDDFQISDNPFRNDLVGKNYSNLPYTIKEYISNLRVNMIIIYGEKAENKIESIQKIYE